MIKSQENIKSTQTISQLDIAIDIVPDEPKD